MKRCPPKDLKGVFPEMHYWTLTHGIDPERSHLRSSSGRVFAFAKGQQEPTEFGAPAPELAPFQFATRSEEPLTLAAAVNRAMASPRYSRVPRFYLLDERLGKAVDPSATMWRITNFALYRDAAHARALAYEYCGRGCAVVVVSVVHGARVGAGRIVTGAPGLGKSTLARMIFPHEVIVETDASAKPYRPSPSDGPVVVVVGGKHRQPHVGEFEGDLVHFEFATTERGLPVDLRTFIQDCVQAPPTLDNGTVFVAHVRAVARALERAGPADREDVFLGYTCGGDEATTEEEDLLEQINMIVGDFKGRDITLGLHRACRTVGMCGSGFCSAVYAELDHSSPTRERMEAVLQHEFCALKGGRIRTLLTSEGAGCEFSVELDGETVGDSHNVEDDYYPAWNLRFDILSRMCAPAVDVLDKVFWETYGDGLVQNVRFLRLANLRGLTLPLFKDIVAACIGNHDVFRHVAHLMLVWATATSTPIPYVVFDRILFHFAADDEYNPQRFRDSLMTMLS